MHSTTIRPEKLSHCGVSGDEDDLPNLHHGVASKLTSQSNGVSGNLPSKGTGATTRGRAKVISPSKGGAQSDNDDDTTSSSSSDEEDPEITAMKEEMMRYVNRGPPRHPSGSHGPGYSVSQRPRPLPPPVTGGSKQRPSAVTLGPGTTAKPYPKPPKK